MTPLAALSGVGVGLGLFLILFGAFGRLPHSRAIRPAGVAERAHRTLGRGTAAVMAALVVAALTRWPVAAMFTAIAVWLAPTLSAGTVAARRAQIAKIEAIAGWAEMLRDTLAGAAGLEQAITVTAPIAPPAIRTDTVLLAADLTTGVRLTPALRAFAARLEEPTADLVIAALILASDQHARRLGDLLTTLAGTARDQSTLRLRVNAGRARTRTSVTVIITTTLVFAVGLVLLNRGYLTPYDTAGGQIALTVVGGLFTVGIAWLVRMARPAVPQRVLAPTPAPSTATSAGPPAPRTPLTPAGGAG